MLGFGAGLADLWANRGLWAPAAPLFRAVVLGVHVAFVLNIYWASLVVRALHRAVAGATGKEKAQ